MRCGRQTGAKEVLVEVEGKKTLVSKPTFDAWVEAWTPQIGGTPSRAT